MNGYISNEDGMIHADSEEEAEEIFYGQCFQCDICKASLVQRTIIVTKLGTQTLEVCENNHVREDR